MNIACPACGVLNEEATELYELVQDESMKKSAVIKRLEGQRSRSVEAHARYADAVEVLTYWNRVAAPQAREPLSEPRVKAVLARLQGGYFVQELIDCIDGYTRFPYLVRGRRCAFGHISDRVVEAELIFRKPQNVDRGLALARAAHNGAPPAAAMAKVPWRKVWVENRRLVIQAMKHHWGHEGIAGDGDDLLWPCPLCEQQEPARTSTLSLRVFNEPGMRLVDCFLCGLTEERLLGAILDAEALLT
jgi:hypothetical protein